MGMVFQEGALFDSLTVAENVGFRLREHEDLTEEEFENRVRSVLGFVDLEEYYDRMPSDLSGGQRRRVALARAIAHRPQFILYDEPTTGLDPIIGSTICDLIVKLRDLEGVTSVLVTHQLRDAFQVAQSFTMMKDGRIRVQPHRRSRRSGGDGVHRGESRARSSSAGLQRELWTTDEPYVRKFLEGFLIPVARR